MQKFDDLSEDQVRSLLRIAIDKMRKIQASGRQSQRAYSYSKEGHIRSVGNAKAFINELRKVTDAT